MHASTTRRRAGASALAIFGFIALIAAFVPGVATAQAGGNPDVCWNVDGFERDLKGSITEDWGTATWTPSGGSDGIVTIDVNEGYEVEVCLKKGNSTYVVGPFGADVGAGFQVNPPAEAPGSPSDGVSHYDVRVVSSPPPTTEPEPETFEVSPAKVWVGGAPAGATATIVLQVEEEGSWVPIDGAEWVFDNEGTATSGSPVELDEGTNYRFVETAIGQPDGAECEQVEVDEPADDTIYNACSEVGGIDEDNDGEDGGEVRGDGEENGAVAGDGDETTTTEATAAVAGEQVLPRTGVDSNILAGIGLAALLAGFGLMRTGKLEELA